MTKKSIKCEFQVTVTLRDGNVHTHIVAGVFYPDEDTYGLSVVSQGGFLQVANIIDTRGGVMYPVGDVRHVECTFLRLIEKKEGAESE